MKKNYSEKSLNNMRVRLVLLFAAFCVVCMLLVLRLGWLQIVDGEKYVKLAAEQQTRDIPIEAKRGTIFDRNGEVLAISALNYSVWARPRDIARAAEGPLTDEEVAEEIEKTAVRLSKIIGEGADKDDMVELMNSDRPLVKIAKNLDKKTADKIRKEKLKGIELMQDVRRHYPNGAFAAHVLGSVTDDNKGLAGLELEYNRYLSGVPGRMIRNTDVSGKTLSFGKEKYYRADNGLGLVLTIDSVIQNLAEKSIEKAVSDASADRAMCIVMDPKTGDILAMASYPDYDPNVPRVPLNENLAQEVEQMSADKKIEFWNKMWRNPMVSDVYEPGSTSKLMTTPAALEEGVTSQNDGFYCSGSIDVADRTLKCWYYPRAHGHESLVEAVGNSCNPVFAILAARLGTDRFYNYMALFGMTEKTGIDFPGEAAPILQKKNEAGPVGIATMSYGQGIAVTMIQQITGICAIGNDGVLLQPRLVKELVDSEGKTVKTVPVKRVRRVISKQTASEMAIIMESVVSEGSGRRAIIPGYRVGGKTGTANKVADGGYSEDTYSSFIGMAPMDDPKLAVLVVIDNPRGERHGSVVAAPPARNILAGALRYMNIEPKYTGTDETDASRPKVTVPDVRGMDSTAAVTRLSQSSLGHKIISNQDGGTFMVVDQYPKPGERIPEGGIVFLYRQ